MSKYTTQLRFICESLAGLDKSQGYNSIKNIIEESAPKIFNFDFPIFDEEYRIPLEIKILRHFYTREICEETFGLWQLRLEDKLNLIMPYYNQLYASAKLEFDPFVDTDITSDGDRNKLNTTDRSIDGNDTSHENTHNKYEGKTDTEGSGTNDTNQKDNGNTTDVAWDLYSDTPQGGVNGVRSAIDPSLSKDSLAYLTNARNNTDKTITENNSENHNVTHGTSNTNNSGNSDNDKWGTNERHEEGHNVSHDNEQENRHTKGKSGGITYSKMLKEYRETFMNIDAMIIEELEPLFFCLW